MSTGAVALVLNPPGHKVPDTIPYALRSANAARCVGFNSIARYWESRAAELEAKHRNRNTGIMA
jgi:hypothetical protein